MTKGINVPSSGKYGLAFSVILQYHANDNLEDWWFIINHDDDKDPNTLANFLHICYAELQALLGQMQVHGTARGEMCIDHQAMVRFLHCMQNTKYTVTPMSYYGGNVKDHYLLCMGKFWLNVEPLNFWNNWKWPWVVSCAETTIHQASLDVERIHVGFDRRRG